MPDTADLFWRPSPGDLVLLKPGSHSAMHLSADALSHPLRVVRSGGTVSGVPLVWCQPTHPVRTFTNRKGRTITEEPTSQQPVCEDELMPMADIQA